MMHYPKKLIVLLSSSHFGDNALRNIGFLSMKDFNPAFSQEKSGVSKKESTGFPFGTVQRILFILTIASVIIVIGWQIPIHLFSPVKYVYVHGNHILSKETIAKQLQLYEEQSWFDVDPYELSKRLRKLDWIAQATVRRNMNQGLDVHVVEKKPACYLKTGDQLVLISDDYLVLPSPPENFAWDLPVIVDTTLTNVRPGKKISQSALAGAFMIMDLLRRSSVLPLDTVSEIILSDPLNLQLITIPDGIRIKLGFDHFERKLETLAQVLPEIKRRRKNIRYIDLRHPQGVVIQKRR